VSLLELPRIFPLPSLFPLPARSPLSGGHLRPPCIPSLTSPPFVKKLSEMSPQDSLYASKHSARKIHIFTLVSRAHPPRSLAPRSTYMYGQILQQTVSDSFSPVQGGRLVAERRMVTDIYMFDIETFTWEKIPQNPDSDLPRARYFHSTDACQSRTLPTTSPSNCLPTSCILKPQGTTI